jgi:large subunit ribosomal protein L9
LDDFNLIIIRQAGETGQLYGSVNTNDVKTSLNENGFVVEKNQVKLDKPIKELGIHKVSVKLHPEVQAIISVIVSRTESEAETLIKGDEIKIESEENLISEDTINLEEVFEEGAVPEDINEESAEITEDNDNEISEDLSNENNSDTDESEKKDDADS